MITFLTGKLFSSHAQVITNTVNCVGVMGKGVALEFKKRHPALFADYQARCAKGAVRVGQPYLWEDDRTQVLNFPTKDHWRNPSRLEWIDSGLRYLADHYGTLGIHSLAMPPLGCGNGGLSWADVKPLLIKHLGEIPDLEVYVYEPAAAAHEASEPDRFETPGAAASGDARSATPAAPA